MGKSLEDIDLAGLGGHGRFHAAIHQQRRHDTGQGQDNALSGAISVQQGR